MSQALRHNGDRQLKQLAIQALVGGPRDLALLQRSGAVAQPARPRLSLVRARAEQPRLPCPLPPVRGPVLASAEQGSELARLIHDPPAHSGTSHGPGMPAHPPDTAGCPRRAAGSGPACLGGGRDGEDLHISGIRSTTLLVRLGGSSPRRHVNASPAADSSAARPSDALRRTRWLHRGLCHAGGLSLVVGRPAPP